MSRHNEVGAAAGKHFAGLIPGGCRGVVILAIVILSQPTGAQTGHFREARETNERLIALYDEAADRCVRNPHRDVAVAVACQSMAIYGMALNERGMCRGKQDEANAFHNWHECEARSMRFPQVDLPADFQ